MAKRPLIPTQALSEFGDLRESADFKDPARMDRDLSYVPGFSEMRREAAIKMAEYQRGECDFKDVPVLPVNLRWARMQSKAGETDTTKIHSHSMRGYELVDYEKCKTEPWLAGMPPGCTKQADGTIRRGDTVLMYCSRDQAAKNELQKRKETDTRLENADSIFKNNLGNANVKGLDPEVVRLDQGEALFKK